MVKPVTTPVSVLVIFLAMVQWMNYFEGANF